MTNISDDQRKNYRLLQSVKCSVIGFSTTERALSATGKYHGNFGIYVPDCTVLQLTKLQCHLFSCTYRPFRLINIDYYANKCKYN